RILSETDSPYLSPFRGEKNSPANIPVIVKKLAELRGEDEEALAAQIIKNAHKLFPRLGV
ncbi:MAG: TatD family hydrolase, partial [Clostridia bacterium]|nr:TatD family hydrolase [Clostridia bacterium]